MNRPSGPSALTDCPPQRLPQVTPLRSTPILRPHIVTPPTLLIYRHQLWRLSLALTYGIRTPGRLLCNGSPHQPTPGRARAPAGTGCICKQVDFANQNRHKKTALLVAAAGGLCIAPALVGDRRVDAYIIVHRLQPGIYMIAWLVPIVNRLHGYYDHLHTYTSCLARDRWARGTPGP